MVPERHNRDQLRSGFAYEAHSDKQLAKAKLAIKLESHNVSLLNVTIAVHFVVQS